MERGLIWAAEGKARTMELGLSQKNYLDLV
jgi:hypothetical protein